MRSLWLRRHHTLYICAWNISSQKWARVNNYTDACHKQLYKKSSSSIQHANCFWFVTDNIIHPPNTRPKVSLSRILYTGTVMIKNWNSVSIFFIFKFYTTNTVLLHLSNLVRISTICMSKCVKSNLVENYHNHFAQCRVAQWPSSCIVVHSLRTWR